MATDILLEQTVSSGLLLGIKFTIMTGRDIEKFSDIHITDASDVTNAKLGFPNSSSQCGTCGSRNLEDCTGHFGVIKFPTTIFHPYFVTELVNLLNHICPGCRSVKQYPHGKVTYNLEPMDDDFSDFEEWCKSLTTSERKFLKIMLKISLPQNIMTRPRLKCHSKNNKILRSGSNQSKCKYCKRNVAQWYPSLRFKILRKGRKSFSIVAEVDEKLPKKFGRKTLNDVLPRDFWDFVPRNSNEPSQVVNRRAMLPSQVFYLLKQVDPEYIKKFVSRRGMLFLSCLPVTPNCHRLVEHFHSDGQLTRFDERTKAYKKMVELSRKFDDFRQHQEFGALAGSFATARVLDCLNMSKLYSSSSGDSKYGASTPSASYGLKWLKDAVLSKRTDYAFRMVVIGDPKIRLDEIGIPLEISDNMFVAERTNTCNLKQLRTSFNLQLLSQEVLYVRRKGELIPLRKANYLRVGDVFYRPLKDGDIVLINRPPSVHQHSMIAFYAKIMPSQPVISINPLCCAPFSGDFDGDCLHGYVPQSLRCRVELHELVRLDRQLMNVQNGQSLVFLTHDSLMAAHLLVEKGVFLNKYEMQQLAMLFDFQLSYPAIIKAPGLNSPLWTGHQLLLELLLDVGKLKEDPFSSSDSLKLPLSKKRLSEILSSIFKHSGKKGLDVLFYAQDTLCEWLSMRGLSVSLGDIFLCNGPYVRKKMTDEIFYGLQDAESAFHFMQIITNPKLDFLLKIFDRSEDSACMLANDFFRKSMKSDMVSVAAFKDVFHDVQNAVLEYINKKNSILAMISAGSKGSLLKLVEQGACVGLRLLPISFSFQKLMTNSNAYPSVDETLGNSLVEKAYQQSVLSHNMSVISSSFLDGLNPQEYLIHASSGRTSMFSANAELPGTLTRKLSFFMRDLYIAYDGTVRSAYGQEIVQFSYQLYESSGKDEIFENACESLYENAEINRLGGQPVGSWAASSLSEAAYGALDHTVDQCSPLINLKRILECGKSSTSIVPSVSLFLSGSLGRWPCGFEYGALVVKNHLEPVLFSHLVITTVIVYASQSMHSTKLNPWIAHFHINKKMMKLKELSVNSVLGELVRTYECFRMKINPKLPALCMKRNECCSIDEQKRDIAQCITIAIVEQPCGFISLDTVRDEVIPVLLGTLVKGFQDFKQVDVLWDAQVDSVGELFVKVTMSPDCKPGNFWSTVTNACVPIMDLIDWKRSYPCNIHLISCVYGIDCAWKYFLFNLKRTMLDIGRKVHMDHLLIVADRLSFTGKFDGLSSKGLKLHGDHVPPFREACFSNPVNSFIKAAKGGISDDLCGVVEAVAWGKEAPMGTGGSFQIFYSGEVHDLNNNDNVYEIMQDYKLDNLQDDVLQERNDAYCKVIPKWFEEDNLDSKNLQCLENPLLSVRDDSRIQSDGDLDLKPIFPVDLKSTNDASLADVADLASSLQKILHGCSINASLEKANRLFVLEALRFHPRGDSKLSGGVKDIMVEFHPFHHGARSFSLVRMDGTKENFSYRKCVLGAARRISPECASIVAKKLNLIH